MILGIGTDILETQRIRKLIDSHGERFLDKWFSPEEITYCASKNRPYLHFAARMAAKEALAKAIRISPKESIPWKEISVSRGDNGEPAFVLSGRTLQRTREMKIARFHLSISHSDDYATATVVAEA